MFIWFILTIAILAVFYLGINYKKRLTKGKNVPNKETFEDSPLSEEMKHKNESGLTSMEKRTAIKTLEKLGYDKLKIIQLLGEEIYDN